MRRPEFKIEEVKHDLRSDTLRIRQMAMLNLLLRAKEDRDIQSEALQIFRSLLDFEQDPWTVTQATVGIEMIAGPSEGRHAWLTLLHHPNAQIVGHAACTLTDPAYSSILMEILEQRPETAIHRGVLYALGRMQVKAAFPVILEHLALAEYLPDAIQALNFLGDERAIPYLEPYLHDTTELAQSDERGATLRVCNLAQEAIQNIQAVVQRRRNALGG